MPLYKISQLYTPTHVITLSIMWYATVKPGSYFLIISPSLFYTKYANYKASPVHGYRIICSAQLMQECTSMGHVCCSCSLRESRPFCYINYRMSHAFLVSPARVRVDPRLRYKTAEKAVCMSALASGITYQSMHCS